MNKNEFLHLLISRLTNFNQDQTIEEIDYGRIEELIYLIQQVLKIRP